MKRLLAVAIALVALLAGACTSKDDGYPEGGKDAHEAEASANADPTGPTPLGEPIAYDGNSGGYVSAEVIVHGYEWVVGPVNAYGVMSDGPFLVLDVEWSTEYDNFYFDGNVLQWDSGGELEIPGYEVEPAFEPNVPDEGGRGFLPYRVDREAGAIRVIDAYGTEYGHWVIDA